MHAGLGGLHRIVLIVDWRCRTSEIVDLIDLHIERERHVVTDQFETFVIKQRFDVPSCAGEKIVHAQDLRSVCKQTLTKMRAEKARTTGNQDASLKVHYSNSQGPPSI